MAPPVDGEGIDVRRIDIVLPALPRSVPMARHAVAELLYDNVGVPILVIEDVLLLVSELVTNSVLHARTETSVSATVRSGRVSVAIGDGDPRHAPVLADRGLGATSGRGLLLVDALASAWGVEVAEHTKVVWFEATYEPEPGEVTLANGRSR